MLPTDQVTVKRSAGREPALNALRTARSFTDIHVEALQVELELWMGQENWPESLSILEMLSQLDAQNNWDGLIATMTTLVRKED